MNQLTPDERKAERTSALNALLSACAVRCPNSPAMNTAQILDGSLRGGNAADAHKHHKTMALLTSALQQVQAGAQTLDLNPPQRQPTVDALRRDLERSLPRGPGQAG